MTMLGPGMYS
jgi:DnaJ-class molecular chaperone